MNYNEDYKFYGYNQNEVFMVRFKHLNIGQCGRYGKIIKVEPSGVSTISITETVEHEDYDSYNTTYYMFGESEDCAKYIKTVYDKFKEEVETRYNNTLNQLKRYKELP